MLIPLNTKKSNNLCLSIVTRDKLYSVAIVEILNGIGLNSVPSYRCCDPDEEGFEPVIAVTDYPPAIDANEDWCIKQCLTQLKLTGEL